MYLEYDMTKNPLTAFDYALKSPESKRQYPKRLKVFLDFLKIGGDLEAQTITFVCKAKNDPNWAQDSLMKFIMFQIERAHRGEIAEATINNYYKATKLLCEMNDIQLSWKKISRGIPKGRQAANDRIPTIEEIRKLLEYPDRRIKPIIYTMVSSGIRIGAWDTLQWKHISTFRNDKHEVIAAKIVVYPRDEQEYYCFITPEAYNALKDWMDFRASYGENITGESWVMRDVWQTTNVNYGARWGLATIPKKLKSSGIKRLLERAQWEQGIRKPLPKGVRRHEWKTAHGFRKFYKTRAEQAMKPINVEITMGHNIGISKSYYKPADRDVLEDYLKAVDLLTINKNVIELGKQVVELEQKQNELDLIRLEHKKEIESMNDKIDRLLVMYNHNPNLARIKPDILKRKLKLK